MHAKSSARLRAITTTSSIALSLAIVAGQGAYAQTAAPAAKAAVKADDNTVAEIVVGTRASLQSAMNRKKRNGTISDSIVAEDIGQFPDKNIGEAQPPFARQAPIRPRRRAPSRTTGRPPRPARPGSHHAYSCVEIPCVSPFPARDGRSSRPLGRRGGRLASDATTLHHGNKVLSSHKLR